VDEDPQCGKKFRPELLTPTVRNHIADFCLPVKRSQQMNDQLNQNVAMGDESGYNRTNVLDYVGGLKMKTMYPPEYVQKITMDAFEVVMKELRAHKDERVKELAQTADACFLLWQLAGDPKTMATMTIGEYLPLLLWALEESEKKEAEEPSWLRDFEEENKVAEVRLKALDALEDSCNWSSPCPTSEEIKARERWRYLMDRQNEFERKWDL
jgi:hypothetical protein